MRQLSRSQGLTLIELMATLAIGAILLGLAAPQLRDFMVNSRLREAGNALLAESLFAQSEAIKRNASVRLVIDGSTFQVRDLSAGGDGVLLRSRQLSDGIAVNATTQVDFNSNGMPRPFGADADIYLTMSRVTCSSTARCPALRIDAGGAIRLCGNLLEC